MDILTFQIAQVVLSVIIVIVVLLQPKDPNLGGSAFGGSGGGETYKSRRGIEQILHYATIVLVIAFCVNALIIVRLS